MKTVNFGTVGVTGDNISWRGILDDETIGPGATTEFHLEVTRPAADGALAAPGLNVLVVLLGADVTIDPPGLLFPGGSLGADSGNTLAAGETRLIDFHVTNDPAGASPAAYTLIPIVYWDSGSGLVGPFVFAPGFPVP